MTPENETAASWSRIIVLHKSLLIIYVRRKNSQLELLLPIKLNDIKRTTLTPQF